MHDFGGVEKVFVDSGSGSKGIDPSTALLMGMMNKGDGFGSGGGSAIWIILLLAILRGGAFGGLCGAGTGAAAAGIANCQDFLAVINAIGGVKEQVANSLAASNASVNTVGDRVIAAAVSSNANLSDKLTASTGAISSEITNLKDIFSGFASESSNRFFALSREADQNNYALTNNINSQFNGLNQYLCNAFNAQTQNFNSLSRQLSDSTCLLSKEIEKTQYAVSLSEERVLCAITSSAKDTQKAFSDYAAASALAAANARIADLEKCRHEDKMNNIIAINSTLQNQIGNIASALGNGNRGG